MANYSEIPQDKELNLIVNCEGDDIKFSIDFGKALPATHAEHLEVVKRLLVNDPEVVFHLVQGSSIYNFPTRREPNPK